MPAPIVWLDRELRAWLEMGRKNIRSDKLLGASSARLGGAAGLIMDQSGPDAPDTTAARFTLLGARGAFGARLEEAARREGFAVTVASSLEQVLEAANFGFIGDAVLVQLGDPAFDGAAALKALNAVRGLRADSITAFLIMGVSEDLGQSRAAFEAGADDVLGSDADIELLPLKLRSFARRKLALADARLVTAESASEHFRILVQGVVDYALYMLDPEGRVSTWNAGAERIKGYRAEEIVGRHFSRFYTPEEQARGEPARALKRAETEGRYETESLRVRKDGTQFWAHVVIDPIRDSKGRLLGYAKITRDITERRLAAEELQQARMALMQAQKMEAIGQLTGGIAHDFNNMLAGIIGGLNLLERRIAAGRYEETKRLIDAALTSANRAASLTSRLLAFGRRQSLDIAAVDVNAAIASMSMLLERTMGENVRIDLKYSERGVWAMTDVAQLESAVLNLAINARDAMPHGGALTIETCVMALDPEGGETPSPGGAYCAVRVGDTGEGMSADVLAKVFDPFFTTKPIGQGTGLGLSMVYGFVRQSGGRIRIESEPGAGTMVTLALPLAKAAETRARPPGERIAAGTGEGILVVEDDDQVRMLVVEVLSELGYRTFEARDAVQALAVLDQESKIELIVSDVGLPGLDGRRFAEIAQQKRPNLKILFITGYAQHAAVRGAFLGARMDMLTKPFILDDLARKVRDMLQSG